MTTRDELALSTQDMTVLFGGLTALNGVSIDVRKGTMTGLIGPNGAGKSTFFNACAGSVRLAAGSVRILGHDVARLGQTGRARLGMGRTFQRMELFDSMTVLENVRLGREAGSRGLPVIGSVLAGRRMTRAVGQAADDVIELCGLGDLRHVVVGALPTGQRRVVELARTLAGEFRLFLLDEPSSGLDHQETARFGDILHRVMRERDATILLVEHDMDLVMSSCEYIYVLDFGQLIYAGTPSEVQQSEVVRAAYLGSTAVA